LKAKGEAENAEGIGHFFTGTAILSGVVIALTPEFVATKAYIEGPKEHLSMSSDGWFHTTWDYGPTTDGWTELGQCIGFWLGELLRDGIVLGAAFCLTWCIAHGLRKLSA
jgi:hypothetical protein